MLCLRVQARIWFEDDEGRSLIGSGGARLLLAIDATGSLREAARRSGMSYRYAFKRVDLMNLRLGGVVKMRRGGVDKGGAELTPLGQKLLKNYSEIQAEVEKVIEKHRLSGEDAL